MYDQGKCHFPYGDHFKKGAIKKAWEMLTTPQQQGGYGRDRDRPRRA